MRIFLPLGFFLICLISCENKSSNNTYIITGHFSEYQEFCFDGSNYISVSTNLDKKPLFLIISGKYSENDTALELDSNLPIKERFNGSSLLKTSNNSFIYKNKTFVKKRVEKDLFDGFLLDKHGAPSTDECMEWTDFIKEFTKRELNYYDSVGTPVKFNTKQKILDLRKTYCK